MRNKIKNTPKEIKKPKIVANNVLKKVHKLKYFKNVVFLFLMMAVICARAKPHSFLLLLSHHQRPALKSSPSFIARVQGAQPMLTNPLSCSTL